MDQSDVSVRPSPAPSPDQFTERGIVICTMFRAEKNEEEIATPGVTSTVRDSVRSGTSHHAPVTTSMHACCLFVRL